MFGILLYMKVASEVSKISSLSQIFLPLLVFKTLFPLSPISKFFYFSGTSVSYYLEHSEVSLKYFKLSSHQDANPT